MRNVRLAAPALFVCALAAQPSGHPPEKALCSVEGRVFSAATGAPLKKAAVWLELFSPTRGVNGPPTVAGPAATTDANGRFVLDGVEPGSYLLSAQRIGYLDQGYGARMPQVVGPPLKLGAGDRLTDITFRLTPQSLLYGKVTDEDGDAVPNAQVEVLHVSYSGGRRQFASTANVTSQDDGSFVVGNLSPGRYYVSAALRAAGQEGPPARKPAREAYVTTYFPNAADSAAAVPVGVAAGAEVRGIEVRLRKSMVFHIRGRVINRADGAPAGRISLHLVPRGEAIVPQADVGVTSSSDGRFELNGVLPGAYVLESDSSLMLSVVDSQGETPRMSPTLVGRAFVNVTDSDVEDFRMPVSEGASVTGTVTGLSDASERPIVSLVPADSARGRDNTAQCSPDGAFQLHRLVPGIYSVQVALPKGAYVKGVKFAGREVTNADIDLTSGAGGAIEIVVSKNGGEVSGTVRDAKGDPARGTVVQLWPADGEGAKTVRSDESGAFRFVGLPPADYRVAAWEDLDDDLAEYPPFRALFADQASKIKTGEGAHETVDLKLIPHESIAAQTAKLK
jgi:protocatechuate 3,4-dioxygenase beta subunit